MNVSTVINQVLKKYFGFPVEINKRTGRRGLN
jgi:hypothetical protein